jgi:hypothetical protein
MLRRVRVAAFLGQGVEHFWEALFRIQDEV